MRRKIFGVLLAGMMALSLVACGEEKNDKIGNAATDIEIKYWNSGLGSDWLDAMIAAFEAENPEYNVKYTASADAMSVQASYGLEDVDSVDLYMGLRNYDTRYMEPLNDVLDTKAYGDSKTIKEKFSEKYLKLEQAQDGNYYAITYGGGVVTLVYNKKMFEQAGITQLPRTTGELNVVCDQLHRASLVPLAHFVNGGYWEFVSEVWFAQASGMDYYLNNFYACTDETGESPSKEVLLSKDGRYDVLKAYEQFIIPEYIMDGSNTTDHVVVQTKFLNGGAAMMANGSWLANEMKTIKETDDFGVMRLPVISSITERTKTIKSETVLRLVISAIDDVTDGVKDISEFEKGNGFEVDGNKISAEDWEIIRQARNMVAANYSGEGAYIPTYSSAKDGAKEFLKFMYSDKGYKVYTDSLHLAMPMSFCEGSVDTTDWSSYEAAQYHLLQTSDSIASFYIAGKHRIFTDGGATSFPFNTYIQRMCSKNASDRVDAEKAWNELVKLVEDNYEVNWLANIK